MLNVTLDVDAGELEAISLAQEIHADAILIDDRVGRNAAIRCGLAVVGTVGLLEKSAARGLIDLPLVVERLRQTNAVVLRAIPWDGEATVTGIASG
jgi:predicted nucleic acid-binding protein